MNNMMFFASDEQVILKHFKEEGRIRKKFISEQHYKLHAQSLRVKLGQVCGDDEEDMNPVGFQMVGNVAVLSIVGLTRASSTWITQYCGIPTYDDIKMRMQQAYETSSAQAIVLNINSPGGEATGTKALAEFITTFDRKVMPVIGYTSTQCCSAAAWYGTAGTALSCDADAAVGSIGAVCVFMSYARQLKDNGVDVKVFRSAPYKMLPNPVEKLDAKGEEVLNEQVQMWHNRFLNGLSLTIDKTPAVIDKTIATGKVFTAQQALSLGLVKSIIPFEQLIANLNAKLDNSGRPPVRA